jgi:hypothetical protein
MVEVMLTYGSALLLEALDEFLFRFFPPQVLERVKFRLVGLFLVAI